MKICTNCGRECSDDTKICPKCGWGMGVVKIQMEIEEKGLKKPEKKKSNKVNGKFIKICRKCGNECDENMDACPKCGTNIEDVAKIYKERGIYRKAKKNRVKSKREKSFDEKSAFRLGFLLCWILPSLLGGNLIYFVSVWELLKNIVWCFAVPLIIGLMCYKPESCEREAFIKAWVISLAIQVIAILIAILVVSLKY